MNRTNLGVRKKERGRMKDVQKSWALSGWDADEMTRLPARSARVQASRCTRATSRTSTHPAWCFVKSASGGGAAKKSYSRLNESGRASSELICRVR